MTYHSRHSMAGDSKAMSQALNLSRQRDQSLIFVSQEARQVDRNVASSASLFYFPDADFAGLLENDLPSFWKPGLSRLFAAGGSQADPRVGRKLAPSERATHARELRSQGYSYGEIARVLGVSKGTIINYVHNYPYRAR